MDSQLATLLAMRVDSAREWLSLKGLTYTEVMTSPVGRCLSDICDSSPSRVVRVRVVDDNSVELTVCRECPPV